MTSTSDLRSPFNRPLSPARPAPKICDVTLRDGEQTVDVGFTVSDKVKIISQLETVGVTRAQVGFTSNKGDREAVRQARANGVSMELELMCVAASDTWRHEIDEAIACGVDVIQILVRAGDEVLQAMGLTRDFIVERVHEATEYVSSRGVRHVSVGPSFTTVADSRFLVEIYATAVRSGATELVINDTLGVARPSAIAELTRLVKGHFPDHVVRVHCHNDFGLAVAGALAGWEAGADAVDVAINGLGERAGNVPLDEFVMAVELLYGENTGVHKERLTPFAELVSEMIRREIHTNKPVVGRDCFAQKLDMHVRYAVSHPHLFEPFSPHDVGGTRRFVLGKGSGRYAIAEKASALGIPALDDAEIDRLVEWVNQTAENSKEAVSDESFAAEVRSA